MALRQLNYVSIHNAPGFLGEHAVTVMLLVTCWALISLWMVLSGRNRLIPFHLIFAATCGCLAHFQYLTSFGLGCVRYMASSVAVFGVGIGKRLIMIQKSLAGLSCVSILLSNKGEIFSRWLRLLVRQEISWLLQLLRLLLLENGRAS
ncbi:hypothetical protein F5Y01DRAFT_181147 [Xylaria sp. FL0043]|nr:hypothetical protein F5Y01DRAFT_181147 [Xylaria sp. FL0043]